MKPAEFLADVNARLKRRKVPPLSKAQERVISERIARSLLFCRAIGVLITPERAK